MQRVPSDVLQSLHSYLPHSLAATIAASEEANAKQVAVAGDLTTAIRADLHTKVAAVRKFIATANSGIGAVKASISSLAADIEQLMTAVGPLEEALTVMQLTRNEDQLQAFAKAQESRLAAESEKHKKALADIRQQRLAQMIEEDIRKAQYLPATTRSEGTAKPFPATANPPQPTEIAVPVAMRKDFEDFLNG